jgi:hypothetical protein
VRSTLAIVTATAVIVGAGVILGVRSGPERAEAASTFTVTPEQLQINQRISQAAVNRSNQSLNYLRPIRTSQQDSQNTTGVQPPIGTGWTAAQIASNAVTTAKIQNGAVTAPKLAAGATQPKLAVRTATSPSIAPGNSTGEITANCNQGEVAVSGGFSAATPGGGGNPLVVSRPQPSTAGGAPTGWTVNLYNNSGVINTYTVYAVCSS